MNRTKEKWASLGRKVIKGAEPVEQIESPSGVPGEAIKLYSEEQTEQKKAKEGKE